MFDKLPPDAKERVLNVTLAGVIYYTILTVFVALRAAVVMAGR